MVAVSAPTSIIVNNRTTNDVLVTTIVDDAVNENHKFIDNNKKNYRKRSTSTKIALDINLDTLKHPKDSRDVEMEDIFKKARAREKKYDQILETKVCMLFSYACVLFFFNI